MPLQLRRDTEANIIQFDPVLKEGEPLWDLDNKKLFIGDGQTPATGLDSITGVTSAEVGDVLAEILDNGTSPNINFVYDSSQSALNVSLDFTTPFTGEISTIVGFRGSLISDDSTVVFDSAAGKFVNLEEIVLSDFGPDSDNAFDIGSASKRFKTGNFYNVNVKDQAILEDIVINGLVKGADSTVIFDSRTNELFVDEISAIKIVSDSVESNLTGSVFGNDSAMIIDGDAGEVIGPINNNLITTDQLFFRGPLSGIRLATQGTTNDDYDLLTIESYHNEDEESSAVVYIRGRGTIDSPTAIEEGNIIIDQIFAGVDPEGESNPAAIIRASADENGTVSNGIIPGELSIITFNDSGNPVIGLNINRNGFLTIADNTVDVGDVDVVGGAVKYLKIKIGNVEYAMPLFNLN